MDKSKVIRNIIISILILMLCMFCVGFFTAQIVYASEGDYNKNINAIRSYLSAKGFDETVIDNFITTEDTFINYPYVVITYRENLFSITYSESNIICNYSLARNKHNLEIRGISSRNYNIEDNEIILLNSQSTYRLKSINDSLNKSLLFDDDYPSVGFIYYSSHDVLYDNTFEDINIFENDVFFLKTTILSPIYRQIRMTGVMAQILSVMMISLGLVVSFLGLRKALAWLSRILKTA